MIKGQLVGLLVYCLFAVIAYIILAYQDKKLAQQYRLEELSPYPRLVISIVWLPFLIYIGLMTHKLEKDIATWQKEHPDYDQSWFEQYLLNKLINN